MKKSSHVISSSVLSFGILLTVGGCGSGIPQAAPNPKNVHGMYARYFGDASRPPILFVHDSYGDASVKNADQAKGGPSLNAMDFEYGMAQQLAMMGNGYFVVVYDQRGQGRSDDALSPNDYTYKNYSDDINAIIKEYNLQDDKRDHKLTIIGHSHGGIIALKYDELNPGIAKKIILVNTPLDVFQFMNSIATNCQNRFVVSKETEKVEVLKSSLNVLSTNTIAQKDQGVIAKQLFSTAATCGGDNGLYTIADVPNPGADPKLPAQDATEITFMSNLASYNANQNAKKFYQMMAWLNMPISTNNQTLPVTSFQTNENFLHINESDYVKANADHISAIYGAQDAMFDAASFAQIKTTLGADVDANKGRMTMLDGSAHNVFVDRSDLFLTAIRPMLPENP